MVRTQTPISSIASDVLIRCAHAHRQDEEAAAVPALVADFRQLRAAFLREGLFKSSKSYYVWKLTSTFALLAGSVAVLFLAARESMLALVSLPSRPHVLIRFKHI